MSAKEKGRRCKARTKAGKPCRAAATEGGLCFLHANPNKAAELGRMGGRRNGHAVIGVADRLPSLENALAVRNTVARLVEELYAGKLHPRIASGLAPLLSLQLRAIETTDLERRVRKLEKQRPAEESQESKGRVQEPDLGSVPGESDKPAEEAEGGTNGEDGEDGKDGEDGEDPIV
jgi:hypothetical protein